MVNVIFFGFGSSYLLFEKMISKSNWINKKFCISQTSTFSNEILKIFPKKNCLFLDNLSRKEYGQNVNPKFIDADKKRFSSKKGTFKETYYETSYIEIDKYLKLKKPDLIFFSQAIECPEGLILFDLAKKNKIKVAIPNYLRFFGGSFFSDSYMEEIKFPIKGSLINAKYDKNNLPYFNDQPIKKKINFMTLNRFKRLTNTIFSKRKNITLAIIKVRLYNLLFKTDQFYKLKKKLRLFSYFENNPDFNCNFVYFPLQYTPESSINVPSPYYVDQLRAIDEIRYSLPKGYLLYVREHPAMNGRRDIKFYKNLILKSRVRLISSKINSHYIIKKSKCVISITGTSAIEAFYFKIPSILLGKNFFYPFLINELQNLKENSLNIPSDKNIKNSLIKIGKISSKFYALAPDFYDITNDENISVLLKELKLFYDKL
tara:strand:+ start:16484 stop:17773 length:1290 start_codon:yes stop_codon:yes gene_type:complete